MGRCLRSLLALGYLLPSIHAGTEARADPITFGFTGTVYFVQSQIGQLPHGVEVNVGDPVSGQYTFESSALDVNDSDTTGDYDSLISAVSLTFAGNAFSSQAIGPALNYISTQVAPNGSYELNLDDLNSGDGQLNGVSVDHFAYYLRLSGSSTDPTSDALPLTPPDPAAFPGLATDLTVDIDLANDPQQMDLGWTLDTFYLVPEASTGACIAMGLLLASWGGRRRTRREFSGE